MKQVAHPDSPSKINLSEKFNQIHEHWSPHIIASLNGQEIKLAKIKGEFVWHAHEDEDEMFMVIKGVLRMEFRDKVEILHENECIVVPRGVEHRPVTDDEVLIMLFEPAGTLNTGNVRNDKTKEILKSI